MRVVVRRIKVYGFTTDHTAPHGAITGHLVAMDLSQRLAVNRDTARLWRSQHPIVLIDPSTRGAEVWCSTQTGEPAELVAAARDGRAVVEVYKVRYEEPPEPASSRTPSRRSPRRRSKTPDRTRRATPSRR